ISAPGIVRETRLAPDVLDDRAFAFFAQLNLPGVVTAPIGLVNGPSYFCLIDPNTGSWAREDAGNVTQGGPRSLWDEFEQAHADWIALGRPQPHRFQLTISPTGRQYATLDHPEPTWPLPL